MGCIPRGLLRLGFLLIVFGVLSFADKKMYEATEAGYYHQAYLHGNPVQRFWHRYKFLNALKRLPRDEKSKRKNKVLDVGCGPGTLLSLYDGNAVGIDISEKQIGFAKKEFKLKNTKWVVGGNPPLPFKDNTFDYVVMLELIEHVPEKEARALMKSVYDVMKPGGKLIMSTPNYMSLWPIIEFFWNLVSPVNYDEQHVNKLTRKKLRKFIGNIGFRKLKFITFFVIAPFLAPISMKLARKMLKIESKLFSRLGSLIMVEAVK